MAPDADPAAALAAWRADGADRVDPLRFRFVEALARRVAAHAGPARGHLDDRLAQALAAYARTVAQTPPGPPAPAPAVPGPGPVAGLVDALGGLAPAGAEPELKALREFRRHWTLLRADQRLHQSRADVPDQAGPLNSQHLVHRTLAVLRELSPEYLDGFMAQVDALLWLEALQAPEPPKARGRRRG